MKSKKSTFKFLALRATQTLITILFSFNVSLKIIFNLHIILITTTFINALEHLFAHWSFWSFGDSNSIKMHSSTALTCHMLIIWSFDNDIKSSSAQSLILWQRYQIIKCTKTQCKHSPCHSSSFLSNNGHFSCRICKILNLHLKKHTKR